MATGSNTKIPIINQEGVSNQMPIPSNTPADGLRLVFDVIGKSAISSLTTALRPYLFSFPPAHRLLGRWKNRGHFEHGH